MARGQDETGPRNAAVENVRGEHFSQRPLLQMFDLNFRQQRDRNAGARNAHSELDVLDGRDLVAGVEAVVLEEDVASNRSTAGPERAGLPPSVPMDVTVQEVAILRHQAFARGTVI